MNKIYVKNSKHHGKGLFAKEDIKKNELIGEFKGKLTKKDGMHVLWINDDNGIKVKNILKYANHDWKNPNAKVNETFLYAKKHIKKGEEILWDYSCGYGFEQDMKFDPLYDNNGWSVVHYSIVNNNLELFKRCLKQINAKKIKLKDVYVDEEHHFKVSLINFIGSYSKNVLFLKEYLKYYSILDSSHEKYNVLHSAFFNENYSIINFILKTIDPVSLMKLFSQKSKYDEYALDLIKLSNNKKFKETLDLILCFVYGISSNERLDILKMNNEIYDNYYLLDYISENNLKLLKILKKYSVRDYYHFLFRSGLKKHIYNDLKKYVYKKDYSVLITLRYFYQKDIDKILKLIQ